MASSWLVSRWWCVGRRWWRSLVVGWLVSWLVGWFVVEFELVRRRERELRSLALVSSIVWRGVGVGGGVVVSLVRTSWLACRWHHSSLVVVAFTVERW
ncbi:hypothetical protein ACXZ9C_11825 [Streptococcus agalactiae]